MIRRSGTKLIPVHVNHVQRPYYFLGIHGNIKYRFFREILFWSWIISQLISQRRAYLDESYKDSYNADYR